MADIEQKSPCYEDKNYVVQDQNNVPKSNSECQQTDSCDTPVCQDGGIDTMDTASPGANGDCGHELDEDNTTGITAGEENGICETENHTNSSVVEENGQHQGITNDISQRDIRVTDDIDSARPDPLESNDVVTDTVVSQDESSSDQSELSGSSQRSDNTQTEQLPCVDPCNDGDIADNKYTEQQEVNSNCVEAGETFQEKIPCSTPKQDASEELQKSSVNPATDNITPKDSEIISPSDIGVANDSDLSQDEDKLLSELSAELGISSSELPNGVKREIVLSEIPEYKDLIVKCSTLEKQCEEHKKELKSLQQSYQEKTKELKLAHQASNTMRLDIQSIRAKESSTVETYQVTVKQLETTVEAQKRELTQFKEKQLSHDAAAKRAINTLQKEMATRVDQVKKMYEEAVKEKESMVIKFAKSEKEQMDMQKTGQTLEKKLAEHNKQMEATVAQLKTIKAERNKYKSQFDAKDSEIANLQKEVEKLKEEINSQGIKVKWAQNKLKTELDSHKETKLKLQKTESKLAEAKEETEQIRKNCQEMIKTYQESEEIKSNSLDIKLKEKETELEFEKQQKSDNIEMYEQVSRELESLKKTLKDKVAESITHQDKIKNLEEECVKNQKVMAEFKELLNNQKDSNRKLTIQVDDMQKLQEELAKERETVKRLEEELGTLQSNNTELENDIASLNRKQSELLQFTEKITAKNAELLSSNTALSNKVEAVTKENEKLTDMCNQLKKTNLTLTSELEEQKHMRHQENELLTNKLEEKSKAVELLTVQLDDKMDEVKTLKRKHAANIKDLSRQLQQATKKLESNDTGENNTKETLSTGSRTSSSGSLDTAAGTLTSATATTTATTTTTAAGSTPSVVTRTPSQDKQAVESSGGGDFPAVNKAMLVERIVKLQKINHRKTEKIDFLEDHANQLLDEMQKKSKIIQQFVLREQTGALAPAAMDANKAKIAKQGGIMASLYKSQATDPGMTLDLSLQINRKLQAVLEDTLLKNITLKENIDTLGDEIASLTQQVAGSEGKGSNKKS
ncbi:coiled-coil domain-containing protein 186-like isoform X2 [Ptychodera flava]|uniref:coiled-coil domain-containing protein 186-like isoform X2 n=1 Tax=Ptychodera flava TaxID=63121 RepID=UPI003969C643